MAVGGWTPLLKCIGLRQIAWEDFVGSGRCSSVHGVSQVIVFKQAELHWSWQYCWRSTTWHLQSDTDQHQYTQHQNSCNNTKQKRLLTSSHRIKYKKALFPSVCLRHSALCKTKQCAADILIPYKGQSL